jgi:RNA polymerase sigma factor (sigma-70 family)
MMSGACTATTRGAPTSAADMVINVTGIDPSHCLSAAIDGDKQSWDAIVAEYSGLVWAVARSFRLASADAADVYQATWLRLVEHLRDIRDGERLGAWLGTTARREALALLRRGSRSVTVSNVELLAGVAYDTSPTAEERLMQREEYRDLWRAFGLMSDSCQQLLRVIFADPPPSYAAASAALDIPVGSIGPTRARCLATLQTLLTSATTA